MKKWKLGLSAIILGSVASLIGCGDKPVQPEPLKDKIKISYIGEAGYYITRTKGGEGLNDVTYYYWKDGNNATLWFHYTHNKHSLLILGDSSADGIVDEIEPHGIMGYMCLRKDGPKEKFEKANKLLAEYKKILKVDEFHNKWKEKKF